MSDAPNWEEKHAALKAEYDEFKETVGLIEEEQNLALAAANGKAAAAEQAMKKATSDHAAQLSQLRRELQSVQAALQEQTEKRQGAEEERRVLLQAQKELENENEKLSRQLRELSSSHQRLSDESDVLKEQNIILLSEKEDSKEILERLQMKVNQLGRELKEAKSESPSTVAAPHQRMEAGTETESVAAQALAPGDDDAHGKAFLSDLRKLKEELQSLHLLIPAVK